MKKQDILNFALSQKNSKSLYVYEQCKQMINCHLNLNPKEYDILIDKILKILGL